MTRGAPGAGLCLALVLAGSLPLSADETTATQPESRELFASLGRDLKVTDAQGRAVQGFERWGNVRVREVQPAGAGSILVRDADDKVTEIDSEGTVLWEFDIPLVKKLKGTRAICMSLTPAGELLVAGFLAEDVVKIQKIEQNLKEYQGADVPARKSFVAQIDRTGKLMHYVEVEGLARSVQWSSAKRMLVVLGDRARAVYGSHETDVWPGGLYEIDWSGGRQQRALAGGAKCFGAVRHKEGPMCVVAQDEKVMGLSREGAVLWKQGLKKGEKEEMPLSLQILSEEQVLVGHYT